MNKRNKKRGSLLSLIMYAIITTFLAIIAYLLFFSPNAYAIYLGEERITTIRRDTTENAFRLNLLARIANLNSNSGIVLIEDVRLVPVRANSGVLTVEQALNLAVGASTYYITAATFFIDGEEIVTVSSYDEANLLIEYIARRSARATPKNIVAQNAEIIVNNRLPEDNIVSFEMALSTLTQFRMHIEQHTVSAGETLSGIAVRANTTVEEILSLNPGLTPYRLYIGQVLTVQVYRPLLTVTFDDVEEPVELEEPEEYKHEYEEEEEQDDTNS